MIRSDDEVDDAEAEASMEGKPTMKSCWNTITNSVMGGGIRLRRTRAACEVVVATAELIFSASDPQSLLARLRFMLYRFATRYQSTSAFTRAFSKHDTNNA